MAIAGLKSISMILESGTLDGIISMEDSLWNSGELYAAPRSLVPLLLRSDLNRNRCYGVYVLLSEEKVYIGQSSDLVKRTNQHLKEEDWWERAVFLTTKDNSFTRSDIDYLEAAMIAKAQEAGGYTCDNKNKGNQQKVPKARVILLDQYLDEAIFLMSMIGIQVFNKDALPVPPALVTARDPFTRLAIGTKVKGIAKQFLLDQGIAVNDNLSYAVHGEQHGFFWLNPNKKCLDQDWDIILNDNRSFELILLRIPQDTLHVRTASKDGLFVRNDLQDKLSLMLDDETYIDKQSGIPFASYVVQRVSYQNPKIPQ